MNEKFKYCKRCINDGKTAICVGCDDSSCFKAKDEYACNKCKHIHTHFAYEACLSCINTSNFEAESEAESEKNDRLVELKNAIKIIRAECKSQESCVFCPLRTNLAGRVDCSLKLSNPDEYKLMGDDESYSPRIFV